MLAKVDNRFILNDHTDLLTRDLEGFGKSGAAPKIQGNREFLDRGVWQTANWQKYSISGGVPNEKLSVGTDTVCE